MDVSAVCVQFFYIWYGLIDLEPTGHSMAGLLPQHHLIISVALPDADDTAVEETAIFLAHGLTVDDIEPAVLALARRQGVDSIRRAARLAATNRAMRVHGFLPLLMSSGTDTHMQKEGPLLMADTMRMLSVEDQQRPMCQEEQAGMVAIGLKEDEYRAIKGVHGIIMGLHLDKRGYFRLKSISKKWNSHHNDAVNEIKLYARSRLQQIITKIKSVARKKRKLDLFNKASAASSSHI